jgi:hypothetical protein
MPALPKYHGQMAIGEPVVFLSIASQSQRGYHAGEDIGDFRIANFDRDKIAFEWRGKTVERTTQPSPDKKIDPALGDDMGGGFRTCVPGDSSPAGTVLAGYKKVLAQTMFGQTCHWEPAQ